MIITSTANAQVKNIIQLLQKTKARKKQGLFVVEGRKLCREMPASWQKAVYMTEDLYEKIPEEERAVYVERGNCQLVADHVFSHMSDTKTPQGILAVGRWPAYTLEQILHPEGQESPLVMVLEDLQDPGNVGTILRTAESAGVSGIILSRKSADFFNPKTVRSTMGSIYRMPFYHTDDLPGVVGRLKEDGFTVYAADLQGGQIYDEADHTGKTAFMIGNEGNGLSEELLQAADGAVYIPMAGQAESLNAAVAAGILMYEAARQRRKKVCLKPHLML